MAKRALNLKIYDFSMEDKARAEQLLEREKFKAWSTYKAKNALKQVEIYKGKKTRALREKGAENINVAVPVFEDDGPQGEFADLKTAKISIAGISPQRGTKKLNLNQNIQIEQLNQAIMDEKLI